MWRGRRVILLLVVLACGGCGSKEKSTTELLTDLKGAEERDRLVAVRSVPNGSENAAQVVPGLIGALKDKENDVRLSAAIKLGTFGEQAKDALPALATALSDHDARVRRAAANAMSRIDPVKYPTPPKTSVPKGK